jgi:hypothetical protein
VVTNRGGVNVPVSATWNGRALKTAESQLTGFKRSFGKAFMGIGAAAGAAVGVAALGDALVGMAKSAAEDQKSVVALQTAMGNIGFGAATAQAEAFISALSLQTAVVDDDLRPAYQKLITASGSMEDAQQGLTLATDLQAAGYGDLSTITKALSGAYAGNTTALSRLKLPLDKAILASGDMKRITEELSSLVGGQASAAMLTYSGKMARAGVAASEAGEAVGYELLRSLDAVTSQLGGPDGFIDGVTTAGDVLAGFVAGVADGTNELLKFGKAALGVVPGVDQTETSLGDVALTVGKLIPGVGLLVTSTEGLVRSGMEDVRVNKALVEELSRAAAMRDVYAGKTRSSAYATDEDTTATEKNITAKERLIRAQERLNGFNQSIMGANIRLAQMRDDGVDPMSDGKKGTSTRDRRSFGLDYAAAVTSKYELLVGEGKLKKAAAALEQGRAYLTDTVGAKFANRTLGTPGALTDEIGRRDSARGATRYRENAGTVYNIQTVNVQAATPAEALEKAKRYARLNGLGGVRGSGLNGGAAAALRPDSDPYALPGAARMR